jgi:hypothetical protein
MAPEAYHFRTLGLNAANITYNFINEPSTINDHLTAAHAIKQNLFFVVVRTQLSPLCRCY